MLDGSLPAGSYATPIADPHFLGNPASTGSSTPYGLTPNQIRGAYGLGSYTSGVLSNGISFNGIQGNGRGQTIAIVDAYDDPNALSDLNAFSSYYGLPTFGGSGNPTFQKLSQSGTTSLPGTDPAGPWHSTGLGDWEQEESLDIEWAHVMAPMANIVLFEAISSSMANLVAGVQTAAATSGVVAVSMSWSGPEWPSEASTYDSYFTTPANHVGGSATMGGTGLPGNVTFLAATGDYGAYAEDTPAITPQYPAASPNVVAVGGTSLTVSGSGPGYTWSSETAWGNGTSSWVVGEGGGGGGGGVSAYETQPSYQSGVVSAFSTTYRTYPDVSCDADPNTGVPIYDSWDFGTSTPWLPGYEGGTSLACPLWAGMVTVADEGRAVAGLGSLDGRNQTLPALYKLPAADFHDITSGNNGYAAGTGYDLASGLGTPVGNLLIPALVGLISTSTTLSVSNATITYGQPVTLTATVSSALGGPNDGTVTFSVDGVAQPNAVAVADGVATWTTTTLGAGGHSFAAAYSGDTTDYAASSTQLNATITTIAGISYAGDGGPATSAVLGNPYDVAVDAQGDIFIADYNNNVIREVNGATGTITTVAGNGTKGYSGNGVPATAAELAEPTGVAVDASGNLFIADVGNARIREVNLATGIITTVAGDGTAGYNGDGIKATAAELNSPQGAAVDDAGDLFIADTHNDRVREVNLSTGMISTVAGNGTAGFSGDGQAATLAELNWPGCVAVDSSGHLFISDLNNYRIREVTLSGGTIATVAGNGTAGYNGDNRQATTAEINLPHGLTVDANGNLYIADSGNYRVREVNTQTGVISTIAGNGSAGYSGDNGSATAAEFDYPRGVAVDSNGDLLIADEGNNRIREIGCLTSTIKTVAGGGDLGDGGAATAATVVNPLGVAVDSRGDIFIADSADDRVREVNAATGLISTVAGNGTAGFNGDGPATAAELNWPSGLALDGSGDLYIADDYNNRIRELNLSTGLLTTVAGNGTAGYAGDGGQATAARLHSPQSLAWDGVGDLIICDRGNNRVRMLNAATGLITLVAGNGTAGYAGNGGQATAAELNGPGGVAADGAGNVYFADQENNCVREVNLTSGLISTIAGNGTAGYGGDGGQATAAELDKPAGLALDAEGNLYLVDNANFAVRRINLSTGLIATVAGDGNYGWGGDGGQATAATLENPFGVAVDRSGHVYIADSSNDRIREVTPPLAVSPAPLTATADGQAKTYGGADPTLTYTPSGTLYNGDTYAVISGVVLSTATGAAATAGSHPITIAGATAANYTVTEIPGTLTVYQAALVVTPGSGSKTYGSTFSAFAGTVSGVAYGDGITAGYSSLGAPASAGVSGSPYPITATLSDPNNRQGNYIVTLNQGQLTVNPATLTVTAANASRDYDAADPAYAASYSGFVNGDTSATAVTGSPSFSSSDSSTSPAGTYAISVGQNTLAAQNYTFTFVSGTLTVYSLVAGRDLFYANSSYNGNRETASAADDNAIDTSKAALLPGQTATYANYTDSTQGINGIMVDVAGLANPAGLTAADFQFLVGNDSTPSDWTSLTVAPTVTVRAGAGTGGSERVELIWPDNAIHNQWLQVTVLADGNTGLAGNDVFYFGAEPGAVMGNGYVSFDDIFAVYRAIGNTPNVTAATAADVNHDGMVTFDDIFAVYRAIGGAQLDMIAAPVTQAASPTVLAASPTVPAAAPALAAANAAAPIAAASYVASAVPVAASTAAASAASADTALTNDAANSAAVAPVTTASAISVTPSPAASVVTASPPADVLPAAASIGPSAALPVSIVDTATVVGAVLPDVPLAVPMSALPPAAPLPTAIASAFIPPPAAPAATDPAVTARTASLDPLPAEFPATAVPPVTSLAAAAGLAPTPPPTDFWIVDVTLARTLQWTADPSDTLLDDY